MIISWLVSMIVMFILKNFNVINFCIELDLFI